MRIKRKEGSIAALLLVALVISGLSSSLALGDANTKTAVGLRAKLSANGVATFETGIRYQMWHALALFAVVLVDAWRPTSGPAFYLAEPGTGWPVLVAGWLFVAGIALFSGSLYALALTDRQSRGAVTPLGGACLLLG